MGQFSTEIYAPPGSTLSGNQHDGQSMAHLEVESVKPARAPLPITETGYRSHFINRSNVDHMGGPEAYVEAWIDEMSHTHAWRETASASRQLALF